MRWRFWRREEPPDRDLPAGTGLPGQPVVGPAPSTTADEDDRPPPARAVSSTASPRPGEAAVASYVGAAPSVASPEPHEVDAPFARQAADAVVALVLPLVDGDAAGAAAARTHLQALLAGATEDQRALAVVVALVPLSERIPLLADAVGEPDEAVARDQVLAYAPLLAGRSEALRARHGGDLGPELLRHAALSACGAADADPSLAHLSEAPAVDQVTAACLLVAQTCRDGAPGPEGLRAEISATFPSAA